MLLLSVQLLLAVVHDKFFCEHISFLLLYVSGIQVVNQSSVYVKLRIWPFLATFSFHHRINDVLDVNDYSCTEDLACHRQDSLFCAYRAYSITTEERDENSSEEEQSSIKTENSSDEKIDPWTTLINDAASKVRDQYDDILQALLMEGHDESKAKEEAFAQIIPVFQKELGGVYMDNLAWMKALKKDPILEKIMATRDDYVNNNMFDPDEAIAAAVKKRKFLLKRLLEGQGRFPEQ